MMYINKEMPVAVNKCTDYNIRDVRNTLENQFSHLIADRQFLKDKNIVIKPNLLMKATPEKAVTTHPVIITAVIEILKSYSPKSITIAESPGGPYTSTTLSVIYKSTGITEVAEKTEVALNLDTSSESMPNPSGDVCKVFDIIKPIKDADIIVNICKLKTHSLTTMSASVKNMFGTIPGIEKFEMHTRYKDLPVFENMLTDLCIMHCENKPMICVVDAVKGMEGNGPSGGDIRNFGLILSSLNPFNVDIACSAIMGVENSIKYIEYGKKRNICVNGSSELKIIGEPINNCKIDNLKLPETKSLTFLKKLPTMFGGYLNKFFEPHPAIMIDKCIGCGECMRSCPANTIEIVKSKQSKNIAKINHSNCIKCYCCQELCPIHAVKIKKNVVFKIIK